ncbi:hypothetical protein DFH06DRAFT_1480508 [Mycena polygramma]|nr:hypothetical protein DFH06DRAFT_1480508 [Mycena polygramma]
MAPAATNSNLSKNPQACTDHRKRTPKYCPWLYPLTDARVTILHPLLEVPLEIWEQITALSGRQAIARLAMPDPPLTVDQSRRLIRTLNRASSSPRIPHLVWRIQSVYFAGDLKLWQCQDALRSLFQVSSNGRTIRGATLRALRWNMPESHDQALAIFLRPGYFPNLKEISVETDSVGTEASFDYIRVPGLEKLDCTWWFHNKYETWARSFRILGQALENLPSSSPLLHTIKLRIITHDISRSTTDPPWNAYTVLTGKINRLRFPTLISLRLSVDSPFETPRLTDFGPFLVGNPSLRAVVLDLPPRIPMNFSSTRLRICAVTGSAQQCAAIAAHSTELEYVSIITGVSDESESFTTRLFLRDFGPTVRHLSVRGPLIYPNATVYGTLSPQALDCLVLAFPNLTHLDIRLQGVCKISEYRDALVALHDLEYLRMSRSVSITDPSHFTPAAVIFPPKQYAAKINETLRPFLPRLCEVHLFLRGTRVGPGFSVCTAEYSFSRERGATDLVLVHTVVDSGFPHRQYP